MTLRCEALGDLPLHVSWSSPHGHHAGQARTSERRTPSGVPGVTSELRLGALGALGRELQGAYRCHASNDFGQDEAVVHLAVKGTYAPNQWADFCWKRMLSQY